MKTFTGMDIAQVRELSKQMEANAQQISELMRQLTSKLGGTQWVGPDATRFRDEWNSQHCRTLTTVVESLRGAAQRAAQNAQEQEAASSR